jgi:outer membrane autotransporter protein
MGGTDGLTAAFAGGDTFDSPARRFSRDRTEVGASLRAKLSKKITIAASYSRTAYGHGTDYSNTVGFQVEASF